ncbi:MAG: hypothetical protein PSV17_11680 [Methylotenera sp.]|uniref:hypothetical protein n=1 Tax=Methylotenera sp. TaxID=2051956 RepID=UPI002489311B|nr:hypothetical protein [Methylotenera sp.]MDI1310070.1 hypothetical protein [Methylotenera sp.]
MAIFSSDHAIWKFAYAGDELDDWLPFAEDLVNSWANQSSDEIKFQSTFEIILASYLLMDDLLPQAAKKAFAKITLDVISEAAEKKVTLNSMSLHAPPPGRKQDKISYFIRMREVINLIKEGYKNQAAYELVATKHHKSPDTIRRDYERNIKHRQK